jgi:hypothetical protein
VVGFGRLGVDNWGFSLLAATLSADYSLVAAYTGLDLPVVDHMAAVNYRSFLAAADHRDFLAADCILGAAYMMVLVLADEALEAD